MSASPDHERVDAHCVRLAIRATKCTLTYGSVRSILDNKLDRQAAQRPPANGVPILHPNIRGPRYYH